MFLLCHLFSDVSGLILKRFVKLEEGHYKVRNVSIVRNLISSIPFATKPNEKRIKHYKTCFFLLHAVNFGSNKNFLQIK